MPRYLLLLAFLFPVWLRAQVTTNPQLAFEQAARSGKPVLLVFQGSDWCIPCIHLERKVLSDAAFLDFAVNNLLVLKVDFPQKKKITPALEKQYEALADQYNPEGSFPKLVLLNRDKKAIHIFRTDYNEPAELIRDLEQELKAYHAEM